MHSRCDTAFAIGVIAVTAFLTARFNLHSTKDGGIHAVRHKTTARTSDACPRCSSGGHRARPQLEPPPPKSVEPVGAFSWAVTTHPPRHRDSCGVCGAHQTAQITLSSVWRVTSRSACWREGLASESKWCENRCGSAPVASFT